MKRRGLVLILTASTWLLVLRNSACASTKLQCLCTECPKAVCTSHYGCYIDVKEKRINTTHARQKITYGCIEEYNITICKRHEWDAIKRTRKLPICCSDEDLCNMPLLLKDVIERKHKSKQAYWKRRQRLRDNNKQPCPEVEPAIQLASVILPSILIAVVFLISFLLFAELIRHRKLYVCEKSPENQISPKSKCKCTNQELSYDLTSDTSSSLTLSSLLAKY
ncbi:uncharacterized protein LOC116301807 [Actinia tenebrosa]|uniref:Uncharacterized protein LOC116301807 n=1 Tax=Actinia tenebrosa TaxID=6105 RepID=A0A6P8IJ88_ACTTE|nr:uncharacterized protein LOC116301807 [Actinia tenebrosa]